MHNIDIRNISLGQIQYFIKVVEFNSFTKAASHVHLTQSAISKNIAALETMLGLQLFIRDKQNIRLTPAGKYLYEKWSEIAKQLELSVEDAHVIQRGYSRNIAIGGLDSHRPDTFILPMVKAFQGKHPDIRIRLENSAAQDIKRMLINGELDVIFTVRYDVDDLESEQYCYRLLGECPLEVCMLSTNPLAEKEILTIADLSASNFIAISPLRIPSYTQMLKDLCKPYGFRPNFTCYAPNANALTLNLITDNDIFICDKFFRDYKMDYLCCRPLENTKSGFAICWRKEENRREVRLFIEEALLFLNDKSFQNGMGEC